MAISSASVKSISRSGGRSATAAAAYRTCQKITDERTGQIHDYTRKGGFSDMAMYLPAGAPAMTTSELWNKAESAENRKNSQVARELLVALPHELTNVQRRELVDAIAGAMIERYGVAAEASIHEPGTEGDQRNHHVHLMFTTRRMDASGQLTEKTRELDVKPRSSIEILWIRGMVEETTNQALERAGVEARIDMRSLADQGAAARADFDQGPLPLDQHADALRRFMETLSLPTLHEGPDITAAKRAAKRRAEPSLSILAQENELRRERKELAKLDAQIYHFEHFAPLQAAAAAARQQEQEREEQGRRVAELRRQLLNAKQAFAQAKTSAESLRGRLAAAVPSFVETAKTLKKDASDATAHAKQWRRDHPTKAWWADKLGRPLEVDRVAAKAIERYKISEELVKALAWQDDRDEARAELKGIEEQLPTLAKQPRHIEDELLLHIGEDKLRQSIEDSLRVVEKLEQSMDAKNGDHFHGERMERVERLKDSPTGADLLAAYRDVENLLKQAQRLEAGCTRERQEKALEATKIALREARSVIEQSPHWEQPELIDTLSAIQEQEAQNRRLRGNPDRWPDLVDLEHLQDAASDLLAMAEGHVQAFKLHTEVLPDGHMQHAPSGPDKPKRGLRPG